MGLLYLLCAIIMGGYKVSACTAMTATPGAMLDGSSFSAHTNDCFNCDFRLSQVPSRKIEKGERRNVYLMRNEYPRYVGYERGETYFPENLEPESIYKWNLSVPIGHIVEPTTFISYSYLEGTYGIINEAGVAMGESTCAGKFAAKPISVEGGTALLDLAHLVRFSLERCATARCAIKTMGTLAETYGYYPADWTDDEYTTYTEGGEALTVSDNTEAWVFNILSDPTGHHAIWAAQRLPDGHYTIVSNEFSIGEVDLDNEEYFLASSNVMQVAIDRDFWKPHEGRFNFMKAYTLVHAHTRLIQRRTWRGFQLVNPGLSIDPDTPLINMPFSVPVASKLTKEDIFAQLRDHMEGTQYDLTKGLAAGPYGNPIRWDPGTGSGVGMDKIKLGTFERAISIQRTNYGYVAQSRPWLPSQLGPVMWFAHFSPHHSVFVPFYSILSPTTAWTTGSFHRFNRDSSFWNFLLVGNWAAAYYSYTLKDISQKQQYFENRASDFMSRVEERALKKWKAGDVVAAKGMLQEFQTLNNENVVNTWRDFFDHMVTKYHDGNQVDNVHVETLLPTKLFYPLWWLEKVGYFDLEAGSLVKQDDFDEYWEKQWKPEDHHEEFNPVPYPDLPLSPSQAPPSTTAVPAPAAAAAAVQAANIRPHTDAECHMGGPMWLLAVMLATFASGSFLGYLSGKRSSYEKMHY